MEGPQHGYFPTVLALGKQYTPEDTYHGVRLACAELIYSGVTTRARLGAQHPQPRACRRRRARAHRLRHPWALLLRHIPGRSDARRYDGHRRPRAHVSRLERVRQRGPAQPRHGLAQREHVSARRGQHAGDPPRLGGSPRAEAANHAAHRWARHPGVAGARTAARLRRAAHQHQQLGRRRPRSHRESRRACQHYAAFGDALFLCAAAARGTAQARLQGQPCHGHGAGRRQRRHVLRPCA